MRFSYRALIAVFAVLALGSAGCGDDGDTAVEGGGQPTVVVTTTILGDVVENLADGQVDVVTIMPVGADPHDFQASAEQVAEIGEAEVLIVNGGDFEEGLLDVIESVEEDGVPVLEALSAVDTIEFGASEHDHDEEHSDEEHSDEEHAHDHDSADPHFWTDPTRMAVAVDAIAEFLVLNVDGVDTDAQSASADAYAAELEDLDGEVVDTVAPIDEDDRVLVTNHDSFGYFADRYEFEIVGTVVPSGSTADGTSARELAELTEVIEQQGVPAVFAETTTSDELAQTLAAEVGDDISVVELYTGSLGEPGSDGDTYVAMTRTNAQRIADALAG